MRKWLPAILVAAVLVAIVVFRDRSPQPVSKSQTPQIATPANQADNVELLAAPPVAALSNRAATPNVVAIRNNQPAKPTPTSPPATPAISLPEPTVPVSELPALSQTIVLENLRLAFHQYQNRIGSNPVGTNEEITRALNGENPRQARLLSMEDGMRVNAKGELVDNWGTPYFFHQLSGTEMEIHSAGPDKKMWTSDDLVIK
jgi:hypothetical protein